MLAVALTAALTGGAHAQSLSQNNGGGSGGGSAQQGAFKPKGDVEHFKDWAVQCAENRQTGEQQCEMFQGVTRNDTGKPVMRVSIGFPPGQDQPLAIFALPLGFHLTPGVRLSVDGSEPTRFPVQICFQQGCRADLPLKAEILDQLRSGQKAQVTIVDPRGREVDLPLSLMGFTAAMKRLQP
jgi:invasion protein IalB